MRILFAFISTLLFFQFADAQATKVRGRDHSCAELQRYLEEEGALYITSGPWDWGNTYYAELPRCKGYNEPIAAYVPSAEKLFCRVGYQCRPLSDH